MAIMTIMIIVLVVVSTLAVATEFLMMERNAMTLTIIMMMAAPMIVRGKMRAMLCHWPLGFLYLLWQLLVM